MEINRILILIYISLLTISLISCSDDDSMQMEKEMEMIESVDLTTIIVGMYRGDSKYGEGSSFFTEDDILVRAEKSSDSIALIKIPSLSGQIIVTTKLDSDSTFSASAESIYSEGPFTGIGSIINEEILINLTSESNQQYEFNGIRQ